MKRDLSTKHVILLGAPTDDVAVPLGGGRRHGVGGSAGAGGGAAQIGPGRHVPRSRMFRARTPRVTATGESGRREDESRPARVWGVGRQWRNF
uniref:Uncharacterized protein n=1 Tax=Arundo donax TaxID=35708 RepID=A0A0A9GIT8_ARUDO